MNLEDQASILRINNSHLDSVNLYESVALYVDSTKSIPFQDIRQRQFKKGKIPDFRKEYLNILQYDYWFKIPIQNITSDSIKNLLIGIGKFDEIDVYLTYSDGQNIWYKGGMLYKMASRGYSTSPYYFPVQLSAKDTVTIFFRVRQAWILFDYLHL